MNNCKKLALSTALAASLAAMASPSFAGANDKATATNVAFADFTPIEYSTQGKPNVIVLTMDDLGYGQIPYDESSFDPKSMENREVVDTYRISVDKAIEAARNSTPTLRTLMDDGVRLTQGYVAHAMSGPSRAAIMTARSPSRYGVYGNTDSQDGIPTDELFLPELFQNFGYYTACVGKWHLSKITNIPVPEDQQTRDYHDNFVTYGDEPGQPQNRGFTYFMGFHPAGTAYYNSPALFENRTHIKAEGYISDQLTDAAIKAVDTAKATNQPFMLYLAYNAPHLPNDVPAPDVYQSKFNTGSPTADNFYAAIYSVDQGVNYIILSDRDMDADFAAIPSLLAVSAVHHHLISVQKRVQTALVVESGEIREVMHAALLLGYGASAINPYIAFAVLDNLVKSGEIQLNYEMAEKNYIKAVCKGLYKIMSKMGISTIRSYRGAKIFEAVGLSEDVLKRYFDTQISSIGGLRLEDIAKDYVAFHDAGFTGTQTDGLLEHAGVYSYRKDGERHAWNPETISLLQLATRLGSYKKFKEFTAKVDGKEKPVFLRDFFRFRKHPIPIEQVEPVESIVKRFVTGAISFGAISKEAHEALALAMNKLGSRSNTGEGGEDSVRFYDSCDGISLCSKTKQVASGRFGVTTEYLVNAEEIQIKVAQGAKPGEGGQLPGFKVNEVIARTRHSIPGISLISPPPHHDIYSIEDLAQLIFDLKNVNPKASISVKLVAESGVGTIAAGVAKAKADLIVVSGAEGGTGASSMSSMKYAGVSPEIGLSETQQALVSNGLRGLVRLQTDGQLKTGKDVISMALLGADEFAFGTAALIVLGCVMMRKCHTNTCPVGVATQDPELRKHFRGRYEYVVNYFRFLAQEVREYLSEMGFSSVEQIIGRTDLIEIVPDNGLGRRSGLLDFSRMLYRVDNGSAVHYSQKQHHEIEHVKDVEILAAARDTLETCKKISLDYCIANTDRSVGAMLSGAVASKFGQAGLPDETIHVNFNGSAGQSFGAFLAHGISFNLVGEANDYLGKGLSGGRISVRPSEESDFVPEDNSIAGNTLLYGATSGEVYINGQVGERFAVRNSGAIAVVEGVGDHCCEYMTGGRVVVLGETGCNFAAGMSGGIAYVWNKQGNFDYFCNMEMVELSLLESSVARRELHELVRKHYEYTNSPLAHKMLADWDRYVNEFIQVTPIEYKKVLAEEQMRELQKKIAGVQRDY